MSHEVVIHVYWHKKTCDYLYHYTTKEGAAGIYDSRVLRQSTRRRNKKHARYGDGVYLTRLDPTSEMNTILWNNYDITIPKVIADYTRKGTYMNCQR